MFDEGAATARKAEEVDGIGPPMDFVDVGLLSLKTPKVKLQGNSGDGKRLVVSKASWSRWFGYHHRGHDARAQGTHHVPVNKRKMEGRNAGVARRKGRKGTKRWKD